MRIRLFSDNTPKIEGISADVTLDIELEIADRRELIANVAPILEGLVGSEYNAETLAEDLVDDLLRDYEFVRK